MALVFPGVALVTGASSGIGAQTALLFAKQGCKRITLADINDEGISHVRVQMLAIALDMEILSIHLELLSEESINAMVSLTVAKFGRIDYACNVAGVCIPALEKEVTTEDFDQQMQINARGTWLCQKAEIDQMIRQEPLQPADSQFPARGAIVNVASMAGLICLPNLVAYCASKHAVVGFTKADAMRHGHNHVRINVVCPGVIQTPILGKFSGNNVEGVVQSLGLRREGLPEEVAECLIWLVSYKASYITATALSPNGGM
ncbi:NAD(P)-binding protein [Thozetella sp. PMI_491]|nr:NAD(P)-binding protein [Thozetella sp. PMI_491]